MAEKRWGMENNKSSQLWSLEPPCRNKIEKIVKEIISIKIVAARKK